MIWPNSSIFLDVNRYIDINVLHKVEYYVSVIEDLKSKAVIYRF